jgi:hypothetical protein
MLCAAHIVYALRIYYCQGSQAGSRLRSIPRLFIGNGIGAFLTIADTNYFFGSSASLASLFPSHLMNMTHSSVRQELPCA